MWPYGFHVYWTHAAQLLETVLFFLHLECPPCDAHSHCDETTNGVCICDEGYSPDADSKCVKGMQTIMPSYIQNYNQLKILLSYFDHLKRDSNKEIPFHFLKYVVIIVQLECSTELFTQSFCNIFVFSVFTWSRFWVNTAKNKHFCSWQHSELQIMLICYATFVPFHLSQIEVGEELLCSEKK